MKKLISMICAVAVGLCSMTFSRQAVTAETEQNTNVLIAYFSRAGENYSVGVIEKGNTELLAEIIAEETGGDLFEIVPVVPYPYEYEETKAIATQERNDNIRPEIRNTIENLDDYDVIFVGYPIWWGDMPMIMYNFLESYDFSGKTIIPFNTHEGSGQAGTASNIRSICDNSNVMDGFAVRGSIAQNNEENARTIVKNWLDTNDFNSLINTEKPLYTTEDLHNLQDFLLAKEIPDLRGKKYDLDGDGVWSVFDLCLMKKAYISSQQEVDATSSATIKE
ncbi:MAG: NAD(P)H-dependent oxidoreductase [Ruminococcus sp.]|nr:NAD(P)H-dependent oxidoreductase [Ruminococcus sp.]